MERVILCAKSYSQTDSYLMGCILISIYIVDNKLTVNAGTKLHVGSAVKHYVLGTWENSSPGVVYPEGTDPK